MKGTKRILTIAISFALVFVSVIAFNTVDVKATTKTQADAVNWVCARGNEGWCQDVDNAYGCQCVDLIVAYYRYLEGYSPSGNACDYRSNALPAGWTRVYGSPKAGDVVVWGPGAQMGWYPLETSYANGTYGHIGVIHRVNSSGTISTIETNASQGSKAAYYERYTNNVACYIRPNWSASTPTQTISWDNFVCQPQNTDARIEARATAPYTGTFTQAGVVICDNTNKQVASKTENISTEYSYLNIWYNITEEMGVSLRPGSKYYYQYWVVFNGTKYLSPVKSFKTTGTCSHVWINGTVTKAATYTSEGVKTYTCKYCAAKGTQALSKLVLKAPSNLSLTTIASSGKPKLSWSKVSGAEKYEVWRKTGSGGTYKLYYTTTGTSMTNKSTTPGTIYYYKVRSSRDDGTKSAFSTAKYIACDLARPTGVKVTTIASSGKPKVTWNKVSGASKYEVWRKVGSNGTYKKFYTTTGTSMTNKSATAGKVYYYKVKAICGKNSGGNSAFSASDYVTCDLAKPKITVSGTKQKGKIVISWSKVTGADRYYIYRATSKNGTYKKYGSTTKTTYTNAKVTKGKYYYYKVKAVYDNKSAANSAYSNMDYAWVR